MSDLNIARLRTALPGVWGALLVYLAARYHIVLGDAATGLLVGIVPTIAAVLYDLGRWAERRRSAVFRLLARVLLGSLHPPTYPSNAEPVGAAIVDKGITGTPIGPDKPEPAA